MISDYTNYISSNDFINQNADVKTAERDFDYHSFYRAYVINTNDPEKLGRVQIKIPALHNANYALPWAYPACFTGLGFQTGSFLLPPVGSVVFVTFEYSDEHRPIYFGGIPTKYAPGKTQSYNFGVWSETERAVYGDDLPFEYTGTQYIIYKAPNGSIIYIDADDFNSYLTMKNDDGVKFEIADLVNADTHELTQYIEMYFDDNNYFRIKKGSFEWYSNGEPVDIGGGGGSGDGTARTIIWD